MFAIFSKGNIKQIFGALLIGAGLLALMMFGKGTDFAVPNKAETLFERHKQHTLEKKTLEARSQQLVTKKEALHASRKRIEARKEVLNTKKESLNSLKKELKEKLDHVKSGKIDAATFKGHLDEIHTKIKHVKKGGVIISPEISENFRKF